nr:MAG TPA: hypothetical protein [Caudoviricetes sp.]
MPRPPKILKNVLLTTNPQHGRDSDCNTTSRKP